METTTPKVPQLAPEQIARAADYVELVWRYQDSEQDKAALAEFHADGQELAVLVGEFGALLLADYISVVPDEHTDCESGYVLGQLVGRGEPVPHAVVPRGRRGAGRLDRGGFGPLPLPSGRPLSQPAGWTPLVSSPS
ncbi:hypothetical protein [Streptomyces sp. NBC_01538]|uniref:hypothetical protein n=1 Tax=Streptomyces sp. NBC_01538 TaxID=2903897 RepID=UPI00386EAE7B